jgi:hypothetical protein
VTYDIAHLKAGFFDDLLYRGDCISGLHRDIGTGDFAVSVGALLAGNVQRVAYDASFTEGHSFVKIDRAVLGKGNGSRDQGAYDEDKFIVHMVDLLLGR